MIIKNSKGEVVRQILSEIPFDKGKHEIKWDGLTTPAYTTPGEVVPAGEYTWEAIQHPPFSLTMRGYASSGATQPWESGPTSNWGGDHGVPSAIATDGEKVYLGWSGAEAGKALLGCDLEGNVKWRISFGPACHNSYFLAVDNGIVYNIAKEWGDTPESKVVRLRAKDGVYDNWEGSAESALGVSEIISSLGNKSTLPYEIDGMDVKEGKLLLSFSRQQISSAHITDWKLLAAKILEDQPLSNAIRARIDEKTIQKLKTYLAKKDDTAFPSDIKRPMISSLNKQIDPKSGGHDEESVPVDSNSTTTRKDLEIHFAGSLAPLKTDFIAICDAKTGKLLKNFPAPVPQAVRLIDSKQAIFISAGSALMSIDLESGNVKKLVEGLKNAESIAVGGDGKIYVGIAGDDQQVKIFSADGKSIGSIGKQGGRQLLGKWQPEGMRNPESLAIDTKNGRLWVMEKADNPKRVSIWNLADGILVKDLFGGTHYGASGAAINPLNPDEMFAEGCEWKLDPKTGKADCVGVISLGTPSFAAFCPGSNKKLYLSTISKLAGSKQFSGIQVYERLSEGVWNLRAEWRPNEDGTTEVWSDANGDGKNDANETSSIPYTLRLTGYMSWQGNFNPYTFNVYATGFQKPPPEPENPDPKAKKKKPAQPEYSPYLVKSNGFTACGAPKWDLVGIKELDFVNYENRRSGCSMLPSKDERYLLAVTENSIVCFDLKEQRRIWSYPNTFSGVHGSHRAPPPTRGVTRGIFGVIGTFNTPETGNVWAMNGNSGEWYLFNDKGYYLSHLFESDSLKITFPEKAVPGVDMTHTPPGLGGEDFGGTLTQGIDGKVYVQAGKIAAWNLLLSGLDKVRSIGTGKVEISGSDLVLASAQREEQLQASSGAKSLTIKKQTMEISGDLPKDFKGIQPVRFQKSDDTKVALYTAWDDNNLYLAWDVADNTPLANGAVEFDQMYVAGDTVDFQFASDPKAKDKRAEAAAGDFRISIGNFKAKPTTVIYRTVSDVKKPKAFSSGVIAHYEMQYVDLMPDVKVIAKAKGDAKSYVVEAAIPWSSLGFKPAEKTKYLGDFGVTYGNNEATRTRLRNYWSNQETGLVDDVVFELKMSPKNWGDIFFEK